MGRKRRFNDDNPIKKTHDAMEIEQGQQTKSEPTNQPIDATRDESLYEHHKRPAARPRRSGKRNVYIKRDSGFIIWRKRIRKLIDTDNAPVVLHAMGAAMTNACNIALAVQRDFGDRLSMSVNTGTQSVVDDFEPLVDDLPELSKTRNTSCITITLQRTANFV